MRLSELAEATGVSVATLKYYQRAGLLHPGTPVSRTQASYDQSHVDRTSLVRALTEVGGLSLTQVGAVLEAIEEPNRGSLGVMAAAAGATPLPVTPVDDTARAQAWVTARGWRVQTDDPLVGSLAVAWQAAEQAGIDLDEIRLDAYADAVEDIARVDLDSVPHDPQRAVRRVVLGTVLLDPLLATLRRMAQQDLAIRQSGQNVRA
ncbi:MerR family transcriptional regulator [Luteococcus sp. Sow4_B9]|uniref:MerR family transcriptional regulator n=1 Tax=Luteococcus sp. Sow4_B9 TaxID=3438792 RepID=UPI003F950743